MQFVDLKSQYLALKQQIDQRIQAVLDHGQYILGPEVEELESALAQRVQVRHCVTVASGTEALRIALMALDIRPGDEVITTAFSFAATAEVIALLGARPVFVDIDPRTCLIDLNQIEARVTSRTRALMPVSLYGLMPDIEALQVIADRHGLALVEDGAQSFGASWRGRPSGGIGAFGCTSFFPSKPLGCYGDGGALFTNDDRLAQVAREIRVHGQERRYHHTRLGLGGRMDTLQCAIVLAKLERFDWELQQRAHWAQRYSQELSDIPGLRLLEVSPHARSAWAQFTVWLQRRDEVQARMREQGIPTAIHYPLSLHRQPAFESLCCPQCCPASDEAARSVLSLPLSADLTMADQQRVVQALRLALS
jgi:UDP-2-acetamido-2-deoxy-ribo-hexuluronate aminotransferase